MSQESPGKNGKNNISGMRKGMELGGGEKSVMMKKKYEREMGSKEMQLARRASDTMGYEMIYKEWLEVIVLYLINKLDLRGFHDSNYAADMEKVLDGKFLELTEVGSRKIRTESQPWARTWCPVSKKNEEIDWKEKCAMYEAYDQYLIRKSEDIEKENLFAHDLCDYDVNVIIEANEVRRAKIEAELKKKREKEEKEALKKQKVEAKRVAELEKKKQKKVEEAKKQEEIKKSRQNLD